MIVWTIQPLSACNEIETTGAFRCDASQSYNLSKNHNLKKPYRWLIEQMEMSIGQRPEGVSYPIWAWHTWNYERTCPDENSAAFLERTEDKVVFTLDIPEHKIVLTDFDAWQNVLNDTYVASGKETEDDILQLDRLEGDALETWIQNSWGNVFNITPSKDEDLPRGKYIQATFWEIRKEYILSQKLLKKAE